MKSCFNWTMSIVPSTDQPPFLSSVHLLVPTHWLDSPEDWLPAHRKVQDQVQTFLFLANRCSDLSPPMSLSHTPLQQAWPGTLTSPALPLSWGSKHSSTSLPNSSLAAAPILVAQLQQLLHAIIFSDSVSQPSSLSTSHHSNLMAWLYSLASNIPNVFSFS